MIFSLAGWCRLSHLPGPDWSEKSFAQMPNDFFGINVATTEDPATDEILVGHLRELGLKHVRCDVDLPGMNGHPARLIERLQAEGFGVMVRLLQDPAATGCNPDWLQLLGAARERFCSASRTVESWEIGATPNRRKWSGYTHRSYLAAWNAAVAELHGSAPLAGPNVSDFEPPHAYMLLARMRTKPDIHTVNLFTERTRTPEAFDHRVLGRAMAPRLKLNLIKKSRVFDHISRRFGVDQTMCTHTCWNTFRLQRWVREAEPAPEQNGATEAEQVEQMRSDLLERYLRLAAASGALRRVYWGPLVGWADGLIDDGTGGVASGERVARHLTAPGDPSDWVRRPALDAFARVVRERDGTVLRPEGTAD